MKILIFILLALCAVFASDQGNSSLKPSIEILEENFTQQGTSIEQLRENLNLMREKLENYQENYKKSISKPSKLETLQEIVAQQDARRRPGHEKQMKQLNFLKNTLAFRAKQKANLLGPLALDLVESYSMPQTSLKMKMSDKQWIKISGKYFVNLFPNESSIQLFRHVETEKTFWVDEENLLDTNIKEQIEPCLLKEEKEAMGKCLREWLLDQRSHLLFYLLDAAKSFVKELIFVMSKYTKDPHKNSLLFAAKFDAEKAIVELISRGVNVEECTVDGWTALHNAAYDGFMSATKALLRNNANINAITSPRGFTPLMHAAQMRQDDVVKLLLEHGADVKIENSGGWTALDSARKHGTQTSLNLIEDHLAKLRK